MEVKVSGHLPPRVAPLIYNICAILQPRVRWLIKQIVEVLGATTMRAEKVNRPGALSRMGRERPLLTANGERLITFALLGEEGKRGGRALILISISSERRLEGSRTRRCNEAISIECDVMVHYLMVEKSSLWSPDPANRNNEVRSQSYFSPLFVAAYPKRSLLSGLVSRGRLKIRWIASVM
ncbi:unnamed protein product [Nezara viridula]|uniref:Uncharacterized protein n=1 Tax=Nezara viridula TaxID=85310 RepID=A0A9P0MU90_NEZVI|nr:unnamed protein product [Nezara viridula]